MNQKSLFAAVAGILVLAFLMGTLIYRNHQAATQDAVAGQFQAIAERPDEKARLSLSPFSKRYLPHFFLGEALLEMDDCEGALAAWAESERQGVVTRLPEYQSLIDGRSL